MITVENLIVAIKDIDFVETSDDGQWYEVHLKSTLVYRVRITLIIQFKGEFMGIH